MRWRVLMSGAVLCIGLTVIPFTSAQSEPATLGFVLSPTAGPPGTRVQFAGDVPVDSPDFSTYQDPNFAYGLAALVVDLGEVNKTVTGQGHITGSFIVGHQGGCFMSNADVGRQPARPGVYSVLLGCHACTPAGTFTITSGVLARTGSQATGPLAAAAAGLIVLGLGMVAIARARRVAP